MKDLFNESFSLKFPDEINYFYVFSEDDVVSASCYGVNVI